MEHNNLPQKQQPQSRSEASSAAETAKLNSLFWNFHDLSTEITTTNDSKASPKPTMTLKEINISAPAAKLPNRPQIHAPAAPAAALNRMQPVPLVPNAARPLRPVSNAPPAAPLAPMIPTREPITPSMEQLLELRATANTSEFEFPGILQWSISYDHEILSASKRRKLSPEEDEGEEEEEMNDDNDSDDDMEASIEQQKSPGRRPSGPKRRSVRRNGRKVYYRTEDTKKCWVCTRASQDVPRKPCVMCQRPTCRYCTGPEGTCPACTVRKLGTIPARAMLKRSQLWTEEEIRAFVESSGCTTRAGLKDLHHDGWVRVLEAIPGRSIAGVWKTMYRHEGEVGRVTRELYPR